jgi:uncharacterized protein (DUF1501 family)
MKRRDVLKWMAAGTAGVSLSLGPRKARGYTLLDSHPAKQLLNPDSESDRVVVLLWLNGGNDGLNTIIPYQDSEYHKNRQNTGFSSSADKARLIHNVRDDLVMNPAMAALHSHWKEGKLAIVENVGYDQPDLSHFRAGDIWHTGSDTDILEYEGWIARWLKLDQPDYPELLPPDPLAVSLGVSPFLFRSRRGQMDVLINDPNNFHPSNVFHSSSSSDTYGGKELKWLNELIDISDTYAKRFEDVIPKYGKNIVDYPDSAIGHDLQHIAQCISAGLTTRVYFCMQPDYDTHFYQNSTDTTVDGHGKLLLDLSTALDAFQRDLEALGVADRVITMTYSEFGRRVSENGSFTSGTDHGTSAPQFILGTKVNGELYGHHPDLHNLDVNGNLTSDFEFRQLYAAVLGDWFAVPDAVRHTLLTPGRDHAPFDTTFKVNGTQQSQHLLATAVGNVRPEMLSIPVSVSPNPFIESLTISFSINQDAFTTLDLVDLRGQRVASLIDRTLSAGPHQISFHRPRSLAGGTYLYRLHAGSAYTVGKVVAM